MDKNRKLTGHPILSQILSCILLGMVSQRSKKLNSNKYYKRMPVRVKLISLLYGVYSYCNGLREICEGMLACERKLTHLGLDRSPARSSLSDANNQRSYLIFEAIYFELLKKYHSFISDSRSKGLDIRRLKIIDSTTIRLFSGILRVVERNPLDGARKKGGIKVHSLMDAFSGVVEFMRMTEAKEHDWKFLHYIKLPSTRFMVFDKGHYFLQSICEMEKSKGMVCYSNEGKCSFSCYKSDYR